MKKHLGKGSFSLLLTLLALLWACNLGFWGNICLGDRVLAFFGLPAWSDGTSGMHYTVWYALILLVPAFLLGYGNPGDLFAREGKWISGILIGCLAAVGTTMAVYGI